jgi:hypothetical protein
MVLFNKIIQNIFTVANNKWNTVSNGTQPCHYNLLVPTAAHIILIYISHYLATTCFGWSLSSGSSQPNSLNLTAIN